MYCEWPYFTRLTEIKVNRWVISDINRLLGQLSDRSKECGRESLKKIIRQPEAIIMVAIDGITIFDSPIIGMASIYFRETLTRKVGVIEDVVVDKKYRGKGIGRKLVELLIDEAKKRGVNCVELTSRLEREIAHLMYEEIGFKKPETIFYRLDLL